jgi:hypothetical protein
MARQESDREDLMREATALVRRVELDVPGEPEPVVCGFHADGRLSVYFGSDPVYHFDPEGRLRRAFVDGHLFRTQGTTLACLTRVRTHAVTELRRRDLNPEELAAFFREMRGRIRHSRSEVRTGASDSGPEVRLASARTNASDANRAFDQRPLAAVASELTLTTTR